MLAGVTPRSFGVLGLTFQFPGVLRRRAGGRLTGADQASTAAGTGEFRFGCGSQVRPGGGSGVVVVPTLAEVISYRSGVKSVRPASLYLQVWGQGPLKIVTRSNGKCRYLY